MASTFGSKFIFNSYQTLIAAQLYADQNKGCGAKIPAGNGKTLIIVHLVKRCTQEKVNSVIVVTNEMLLRQMQTYVDMYCTDDTVEIALIYELTVSQCVGKAVFLDEADEMIEMFPAHFIPTKILISGLAAANCAMKIYLLGATYDTYCELFID